MSRRGLLLILLAACDADPQTEPTVSAIGRCIYENPFSRATECKEYVGAGWSIARAKTDCRAAEPLGVEGVFEEARCADTEILGRCVVDPETELSFALVFDGTDAAACGSTAAGCETFAGGTFEASTVCDGTTVTPPSTASVFTPPYQDCRPPLSGEAPGQSNNGEVCTNVLVSGCTEPGRAFDQYASCDDVRTQRPYFAYDRTPPIDGSDARLADADYMAELGWVKEQVQACSCVCCHAALTSPDGASGWSVDAGPLWLDSISDDGLAMLAGLVDSTAFGTYDAAENNGFDRSVTGLPTTDVPRMQGFLLAEYMRRGRSESDAAAIRPFGGPLYDQLIFRPEACGEGEGIDNGRLQWSGGEARYVYVLSAAASSPGVPPNLDLPDGTIWRVDVAPDGTPLASGLTFGEAGEAAQRFPQTGAPTPLVSGESYYLYVLRDVGIPITRCLFTAG